jgi:nucleoredoxin
MIRMGVPEAEIARDVSTRKLLVPIDATAETTLRTSGASVALLQKLKSGDQTISADEAARVQQMQAQSQVNAEKERAADAAAFAARDQQLRQSGAPVTGTVMREMFDGKLVRMENGSLRPYSGDELRNVKYYALYYSAHWCGPCRKFTPELVKFYQQFKQQHPEFEVIFISGDHNPEGMREYMKSSGMPWPAVKFEMVDAKLRGLAGSGIPWLGIYNASGQPISNNGKTKQWTPPAMILAAFQQALNRSPAR